MKQETIEVVLGRSGRVSFAGLIVSIRNMDPYESCEVIVGCPGLPNVKSVLNLGDAMLYETTEDGILEVRITQISNTKAEFLISQVSPRTGVLGGLLTDDPNNLPFSNVERDRIADSMSDVKGTLETSGKFTQEQFALVDRKLNEIAAAAERLGKKDWINYVAGSLTTLCVSAAFAPDVAKALFNAVNSAFAWFFANTATLLLK